MSHHKKNISSSKQTNVRNISDTEQFTELQIVTDVDVSISDRESFAKLTNSWVSLDNSVENFNINKLNDIGHISEQLSESMANTRKSDLCEKDLAKLGYVVPDNSSDCNNVCNKSLDSHIEDDESSLVFVTELAPKDEDILIVDHEESRLHLVSDDCNSLHQSLCSNDSLNTSSLLNTSDSFCYLAPDSLGLLRSNEQFKIALDISKSDKSQFNPQSELLSDKGQYSLDNNSPTYHLQKNLYPHHPEFINDTQIRSHKSMLRKKYPEATLPAPKPPPELGLPDLTKKHLFSNCPADTTFQLPPAEGDASALVKNKVLGIWNNVKYGKFIVLLSLTAIISSIVTFINNLPLQLCFQSLQ